MERARIAIVGAGIVGLSHALEAAKRGHAVTVFERNPRASGASIRNFGMILPLGMTPGIMHERALRSRTMWQQLAGEAGFWLAPDGAMVVAYHDDEKRVLEEFIEWGPAQGYPVSWLDTGEAARRSPVVNDGLLGALWSSVEALVDPGEALTLLPLYLEERYDVRFEWGASVTRIALPDVEAGGKTCKFDRVVVCCGSDIETLYPVELKQEEVCKCKLQMMRTRVQPAEWRMGPYLATGLSLPHYGAFAACPSVKDVKARIAAEAPEIEQWGIHILVAQHADGSLTIGDSHEYGNHADPFDRPEIDEIILTRLHRFLRPPILDIAARWHGVYLKTPSGEPLVLEPAPDVRVVTGLGGAGMTTSFALAQDVFEDWE